MEVMAEHVVKPRYGARGGQRLLQIMQGVHAFLEHQPIQWISLAVIEGLAYGAFNTKTVTELGKAAGMAEVVLASRDIDVVTCAVRTARKWALGRGDTDKQDVAKWLERRYGMHFEQDPKFDLSDAALLAVWGMGTQCEK